MIFVIGLIIGAYALYYLFLKSSPDQVKRVVRAVFIVVAAFALLFLALTQRLLPAILLCVIIVPMLYSMVKEHRQRRKENPLNSNAPNAPGNSSGAMSRDEALDILGLTKDSDEKEIKAAYKRLMNKIHPDHEGSEGLARKLNEARKTLLGY